MFCHEQISNAEADPNLFEQCSGLWERHFLVTLLWNCELALVTAGGNYYSIEEYRFKEVSCRSIVVIDIAIWGDQLVPFEACLGEEQGTAC